MKIAYLECFAGIAGDMFLGALVDAGVDPAILQRAADSLHLGVALDFQRVDRSGIQSTKARVLLNGVDAEAAGGAGLHNVQEETQHQHNHAHTHTHTHADAPAVAHVHGRSLQKILAIIETASISANAKRIAILAFMKLGAAEAKVHGTSIDDIHFHEVGAVDAIVDIVCGAVGADTLGVEEWYATPVNVGSGFVECTHGRFPVPAPATVELLRGVPVYVDGPAKELTTPTGAALLAALACRFDRLPAFKSSTAGYGAGSRNPERFPNVLRLQIGDFSSGSSDPKTENDTVTVLECAIDDATPEVLASAAGSLLEHGALDVTQQAVTMKKGRQGTIFTVLCRPSEASHIAHILFRETTTLGVRMHEEQRVVLERKILEVVTEFGAIRMKLGIRDGSVLNVAPEFEDCRQAAHAHGAAVKQVMQSAVAVYEALHADASLHASPSFTVGRKSS